LRHGIPAEPITGRHAVPGLYVKFENGLVDVHDQETIELLESHKGFGSDFIREDKDPFERRSVEPEHSIQEIKYGQVEKELNPKKGVKISPEVKKYLGTVATEMAKGMAKEMVKDILSEIASGNKKAKPEEPKEEKKETKPKKDKETSTDKIKKEKKDETE